MGVSRWIARTSAQSSPQAHWAVTNMPGSYDAMDLTMDRESSTDVSAEAAAERADERYRGIGRFSAAQVTLVTALVALACFWLLSGFLTFLVGLAFGIVAVAFARRAIRGAHYVHNASWWIGVVGSVLVIGSLIAMLLVGVLIPDKSRATGGRQSVFGFGP